jgi:hypothetical protein
MQRVSFLVLALTLWGTLQAETALPTLLEDAQVVVRANDLLWCQRQITSFAAAANLDPTERSGMFAGMVFRSRSLAGMDLSRPALMAWRNRPAPLLAIIPIIDRRAFLEDFGADTQYGTPLVRVAEREGSTVYKQNTDEDLVEYRLLIQDDVAYLAPTVAECLQLAALRFQRIGEGAPLQIRLHGGSLMNLPAFPGLSGTKESLLFGPTITSLLHRYGMDSITRVADQIARIDLNVHDGDEGHIVIDGNLLARSDAPLAQFLAVQKNQSSRLLPLVESANTAAVFYGSVTWQGELDRLGQDLTEKVGPLLGSAWNAQAEDSWRRAWAARDRNGVFVAVANVLRDEQGKLDCSTTVLTEQNRGSDLVVHAQRFATAEQAYFAKHALPGHQVTDVKVEDVSIAGLPGWRESFRLDGHPADFLQIATGRHILGIDSRCGRALAIAEELVPRVLLDGGQKPEGESALFAGWFDPGILARAHCGDPLVNVPAGRLTVSAKSSSQGDLSLHLDVPVIAFAILEREWRAVMARPGERR